MTVESSLPESRNKHGEKFAFHQQLGKTWNSDEMKSEREKCERKYEKKVRERVGRVWAEVGPSLGRVWAEFDHHHHIAIWS